MKNNKRKLAEQIANELFSNGDGKKAARLQLMMPPKHPGGPEMPGGGWCETAAVEAIVKVLTPAKPK